MVFRATPGHVLLLGTASWLIAATLTAAILSMPGGFGGQWFWPVILLSLLEYHRPTSITAGICMANHCVREPARWRTNNRDWRSWLAVSVCPSVGAGADSCVAGAARRSWHCCHRLGDRCAVSESFYRRWH